MNPSDYKYCPRCKSDLTNTSEAFRCRRCGMVIYKNSAPTASVLILRDRRLLLARRNAEPHKGEYDVVGGFLKYGEDPLAGALRETLEETGLEVHILGFLGVYMDRYGRNGKHTLNFYYVGSIKSGRIRPQDDVAELIWFPLDELPDTAFRSQQQVFRDLRRWCKSRPRSTRQS